jgi:hypothetical protein
LPPQRANIGKASTCHFLRRITQERRETKIAAFVALTDEGWEWGVESKPTAVKNVVFSIIPLLFSMLFVALLPSFTDRKQIK